MQVNLQSDPDSPVLIFAPLATVSHAAFRFLLEEQGPADLYFTEMIDAPSLIHQGKFEKFYTDPAPCPEKVVFQLVGSQEDSLVKAAEMLNRLPCRGIDINMGCSAPQVFRHGSGIAWMKDATKAEDLARQLRSVINPEKTLSMKFRLGETEDFSALVRFAQALERGGANFLTLHPRIRRDSLSRPARWHYLPLLKRELGIPLIGNGDLSSFSRFQTQLNTCDGFMVGRQVVQAPWTFKFWRQKLRANNFDIQIDLAEVAQRFHHLLEIHQPPEFWPTRTKRFYHYFCHNLLFGHTLAARINGIKDYPLMKCWVAEYWDQNPLERVKWASTLEH